jgi:shikimate dehydrogenase
MTLKKRKAGPMIIDGKTQLVGLIGWPVAHSFSPAMHNAAAAALGLNMVYVPLPVRPQDLPAAVQGLPRLGFSGVNVTVPHKQRVMPFLDSIEEGARLIGAVNTMVINRDPAKERGAWQLAGTNTDWLGFLADLDALQIAVKQRDCLVLGAGGSARAVVYALAQAKGDIHLLARRTGQAEQLAADFSSVAEVKVDNLAALAARAAQLEAPLIINCTPLGMTPDSGRSVWPDALPLPDGATVYDLVYNPLNTRLMGQAEAAGCQASNGLGMLVQQGALAFELWTGKKPDVAVMEAALPAAEG